MPVRKIWYYHCDNCGAEDIGYLCDDKKTALKLFRESGYKIMHNGKVCFCDDKCHKEFENKVPCSLCGSIDIYSTPDDSDGFVHCKECGAGAFLDKKYSAKWDKVIVIDAGF